MARVKVELQRQNWKAGATLFDMNKITQDMLFKQAVIEYSLKHGVITAAIRYKPADKIFTAGGRNMMEQFALWQTAHIVPTAIPISIRRQRSLWSGICTAETRTLAWWCSGSSCGKWGGTRSISGLYKLLHRIGGNSIKLPTQKYIPKPYEKMQYPGQRVQIDVRYVPSLCLVGETTGEKYYQYTFIDEYSRFRYLEAFKAQSAYSFTQFLKYVAEKFPYAVECVQTDNGFEFTNEIGNSKKASDTLWKNASSARHSA